MSQPSFIEKLTAAIERNNSLLCVGLDPDPRQFPAHFPAEITTTALVAWGRQLIEQTADLVCCYKPNSAFYEQYGPPGIEALRQTIAAVPADIPVMLDAKRGDIGSTAAAYARAAIEVMRVDAVTLGPYVGADSIVPFLAYSGTAAFVLCFTSNPSAAEVQEFGAPGERMFEFIARRGQGWGNENQIGFVVGATRPNALARVRQLAPNSWILAPGIGAQGGDLQAALAAGLNAAGSGLIVPVSRGVIYADDPRAAAQQLRDDINAARQALRAEPPAPLPANHDLILQLHDAGCVQFGNFTLASGQQSPIYIDLRRLGSSAALLNRAARAYAELLRPLSFNHIAAVPYAALTIGTAVALHTGSSLIYPRKEAKAYGTGKNVEGVFAAGDTALVIEDLVTSGGSVLKAIEQLKSAGLQITDVAVLIDREQGGPQNLADAGYRLHAALQISHILDVLLAEGRVSTEQAAAVRAYLSA
ncbi:MAG: hypothetical protein Kow0031_24720 [Anaerolineae bacterium]